MPTYVYRCIGHCGDMEIRQSIHDSAIDFCPNCGRLVDRVPQSPTGIQFKGSGFASKEK